VLTASPDHRQIVKDQLKRCCLGSIITFGPPVPACRKSGVSLFSSAPSASFAVKWFCLSRSRRFSTPSPYPSTRIPKALLITIPGHPRLALISVGLAFPDLEIARCTRSPNPWLPLPLPTPDWRRFQRGSSQIIPDWRALEQLRPQLA
jgi:hypothetical protein